MIQFTTTILKFGSKGEKTAWTYVVIPVDVAQELKPGNKKSFRVKGKLDDHTIKSVALIPMGGGDFILPLKADIRKKIGKKHGALLNVQLAADNSVLKLNSEMMECLVDEPKALEHFNKLAKSHQRYFSVWIESAKTDATKTKRIAQCLNALSRGQNYGEMIRSLKKVDS